MRLASRRPSYCYNLKGNKVLDFCKTNRGWNDVDKDLDRLYHECQQLVRRRRKTVYGLPDLMIDKESTGSNEPLYNPRLFWNQSIATGKKEAIFESWNQSQINYDRRGARQVMNDS